MIVIRYSGRLLDARISGISKAYTAHTCGVNLSEEADKMPIPGQGRPNAKHALDLRLIKRPTIGPFKGQTINDMWCHSRSHSHKIPRVRKCLSLSHMPNTYRPKGGKRRPLAEVVASVALFWKENVKTKRKSRTGYGDFPIKSLLDFRLPVLFTTSTTEQRQDHKNN